VWRLQAKLGRERGGGDLGRWRTSSVGSAAEEEELQGPSKIGSGASGVGFAGGRRRPWPEAAFTLQAAARAAAMAVFGWRQAVGERQRGCYRRRRWRARAASSGVTRDLFLEARLNVG
jgi:hypothetical protein